MATSGSDDMPSSTGPWTAGALLFSGRPNPVWTLDQEKARELLGIWESLKPATAAAAGQAPALGYSGCFMQDPQGRIWTAGGGMVVYTGAADDRHSRRDPGRRFEKLLLASAPAHVVPAGFGPRLS